MISDIDIKDEYTTTIVVHKFNMGDVEDPDLWAGQSLWEWENSDSGKWVMQNSAPTPSWHRISNNYMGWTYEIRAYFNPKQLTYYKLKYE